MSRAARLSIGVLMGMACGGACERAVVPATPVRPEPARATIVPLDVPDAAFVRDHLPAGHTPHFATELSIDAADDETIVRLRFAPPLNAPRPRVESPLPPRLRGLRHVDVSLLIDCDADATTGVPLDRFFAAAPGWEDEADAVRDFGGDRVLTVEGKRWPDAGPSRPWALTVRLSRFEPKVVLDDDTAVAAEDRERYPGRKVMGVNLTSGPVLTEWRETDPHVRLADGTLTLTFPSALLDMHAGGRYKVELDGNAGFGPSAHVLSGIVGSPLRAADR